MKKLVLGWTQMVTILLFSHPKVMYWVGVGFFTSSGIFQKSPKNVTEIPIFFKVTEKCPGPHTMSYMHLILSYLEKLHYDSMICRVSSLKVYRYSSA